jgi:hypothetical protein
VRGLQIKIRNEAAIMDEANRVAEDALYEEEDGFHAKA